MTPNKYTFKKSHKNENNITNKLNSINHEINLFEFDSMNIFPKIITRLAKIGHIDNDMLNNLFSVTYEHHKNIIEDFKNKIIDKKKVKNSDLKNLINQIIFNQIQLQSSPKFVETIQKGGYKIIIGIAETITYILSLFFLISTLLWLLLFIIRYSLEFSDDGLIQNQIRRIDKTEIYLEFFLSTLTFLCLNTIRNKLSKLLKNKSNSNNDSDSDSDTNTDFNVNDNDDDDDDDDDLNDLITTITGSMYNIVTRINNIPLSVRKINKKISNDEMNSIFSTLPKTTIPYHNDTILTNEILEVDLAIPTAIQKYKNTKIPSSKKQQKNIPLTDKIFQIAYTEQDLADDIYDLTRVHVRNLNNPVVAKPISQFQELLFHRRRGGTKKMIQKNRRNTMKKLPTK